MKTNQTLKFQRYYTQKHYHPLLKICEKLLQCKSSLQFSAKKITTIDFVSVVRLNKSSTNDCVKLMMLLTTDPRMPLEDNSDFFGRKTQYAMTSFKIDCHHEKGSLMRCHKHLVEVKE